MNYTSAMKRLRPRGLMLLSSWFVGRFDTTIGSFGQLYSHCTQVLGKVLRQEPAEPEHRSN